MAVSRLWARKMREDKPILKSDPVVEFYVSISILLLIRDNNRENEEKEGKVLRVLPSGRCLEFKLVYQPVDRFLVPQIKSCIYRLIMDRWRQICSHLGCLVAAAQHLCIKTVDGWIPVTTL